MLDIQTNPKEGSVQLSLEGTLRDVIFDLVLVMSSVTGTIQDDEGKEVADGVRKTIARYLIDTVKDGDALNENRQRIEIDGDMFDFLKAYKQSRDEYDD